MKCPYSEKTILYFYGELSREEMAEVRRHASKCPACSSELEFLENLKGVLPLSEPEKESVSAVMAAAKENIGTGERFFSWLFRDWRRASLAFAFSAVSFILFFRVSGNILYKWDGGFDAFLDSAGYAMEMDEESDYYGYFYDMTGYYGIDGNRNEKERRML